MALVMPYGSRVVPSVILVHGLIHGTIQHLVLVAMTYYSSSLLATLNFEAHVCVFP